MLPIILCIRDDDDRAFVEKLYVEYEHKLHLISKKYLNNHHDAVNHAMFTIEAKPKSQHFRKQTEKPIRENGLF